MTIAEFISIYDYCAINLVPIEEAIKIAIEYGTRSFFEVLNEFKTSYICIRFQNQSVDGYMPEPYLDSDPCFKLDKVVDWDDLNFDSGLEVSGLDSLL